MATSNLTVRMDEKLKKQGELLFKKLGMNPTTAITVFYSQAIREQRIPFEISADPFYSEENLARLRHSAEQADRGELLHKSMEELERMAE